MANNRPTLGTRYIIEGQGFARMTAVMAAARERGYNGSMNALIKRMEEHTTWDAIAAPVSNRHSSNSKSGHSKRRNEMAELIARLDARKAMMAN